MIPAGKMLHILVAFVLTNDTPKLVVVEKLYQLSEFRYNSPKYQLFQRTFCYFNGTAMILLAELAARAEPMLAELAARAEPLVSVEDIGHCIECEEAISRDVMREMGMFVVDSLYDIWSLKRLWFWLQQQ